MNEYNFPPEEGASSREYNIAPANTKKKKEKTHVSLIKKLKWFLMIVPCLLIMQEEEMGAYEPAVNETGYEYREPCGSFVIDLRYVPEMGKQYESYEDMYQFYTSVDVGEWGGWFTERWDESKPRILGSWCEYEQERFGKYLQLGDESALEMMEIITSAKSQLVDIYNEYREVAVKYSIDSAEMYEDGGMNFTEYSIPFEKQFLRESIELEIMYMKDGYLESAGMFDASCFVWVDCDVHWTEWIEDNYHQSAVEQFSLDGEELYMMSSGLYLRFDIYEKAE